MFNKLTQQFKDWQHQRYLKERGWTQEIYERQTDVDFNYRASTVGDAYHGYSYILSIQSTGPLNHQFGDWMGGLEIVRDWCRENCREKFRDDIMRVYAQTPIGTDGPGVTEWWINDIGGQDVLFWAFKNDQDCVWFKLKWGHLLD